jgi:hypothetical protein
MRNKFKQCGGKRYGSVLVLAVVALVILSAIGVGLLAVAYGVRHQAITQENEAVSMMAAEAGYERAVFWMSQQQDVITSLRNGVAGSAGTVTFPYGYCNYSIAFYTYIGARPIYRIVSNGYSGTFNRTVDVLVMQAITGWDIGDCVVPIGPTTTCPVYYISGEVINMPIHINNNNDNPGPTDIYISGDPTFLQRVDMGESRYTTNGTDKYSSIINLFEDGIYFNQPDSMITDEESIESKVERFQGSTNPSFQFTPVATAPGITNPLPAVQLEFFVNNGVGEVRITDNCTVRGFEQPSYYDTYDFDITPGSDPETFQMYDIYAYHLMPQNADSTGQRTIVPVSQTYVSQSYGGVTSEAGGQIFVNGNVIIGSGDQSLPGTNNTVNGRITVVATGNIWVANSIQVDGSHDANGVPTASNPNMLGLVAQGVVKVVDPGMTNYPYVGDGGHPKQPSGYVYVPIGLPDSGQPANTDQRHLPNPMVVEAGITSGDGGWGAENVCVFPGYVYGGYGGRKGAYPIPWQDNLIVNGTLTEACRGIVGLSGWNGYMKHYNLDSRLLQGVLPGDIWMQGKYIPTPAGWHDYQQSSD